jgi:Rod binding domain-containing protein
MNSTGILPTAASAELSTPTGIASRGAKAAREFEAQLIGSVLESFEKTFTALPGKDSTPGSDDYRYLGAQALGQALAAKGGFGIAAIIEKHLTEKPAKTRK